MLSCWPSVRFLRFTWCHCISGCQWSVKAVWAAGRNCNQLFQQVQVLFSESTQPGFPFCSFPGSHANLVSRQLWVHPSLSGCKKTLYLFPCRVEKPILHKKVYIFLDNKEYNDYSYFIIVFGEKVKKWKSNSHEHAKSKFFSFEKEQVLSSNTTLHGRNKKLHVSCSLLSRLPARTCQSLDLWSNRWAIDQIQIHYFIADELNAWSLILYYDAITYCLPSGAQHMHDHFSLHMIILLRRVAFFTFEKERNLEFI